IFSPRGEFGRHLSQVPQKFEFQQVEVISGAPGTPKCSRTFREFSCAITQYLHGLADQAGNAQYLCATSRLGGIRSRFQPSHVQEIEGELRFAQSVRFYSTLFAAPVTALVGKLVASELAPAAFVAATDTV